MGIAAMCLFWGLALCSYVGSGKLLLNLFFASFAFGSFAVIPTNLTGGVSLTASSILALLLIVRVLATARGLAFALRAGTQLRWLGILSLFWLAVTITTIFMPRLFEGQITVVPMRYLLIAKQPLAPTMQNVTQLAYLSISVLVVFTIVCFPIERLKRPLIVGLFVGAITVVVTGLLDMASQYLPIGPLLDGFRTASYIMRAGDEVLGAKRIVGLQPEASAFGDICVTFLSLLFFLRHVVDDSFAIRKLLWPVMGMLLVLACLSTSSATYVGLAVFGAVACAEWIWRLTRVRRDPHGRRLLRVEAGFAAAGLVGILALLLFAPHVFDPALRFVDELIFKKTSSASFEERSMWTTVSLQAAFDTYGLGVGLGATRASSSFVSGLSNFGVIGAGLYLLFLAQCCLTPLRQSDPQNRKLVVGLRWSILSTTVPGWMAGTSPDFGSLRAVVYGTIVAATADAVRRHAGGRRLDAASQDPAPSSPWTGALSPRRST